MSSQVKEIPTKPFDDQKPSPYGLIKRLALIRYLIPLSGSDCKA